MAARPIMPRDKAQPTGQAGRDRNATADFRRRFARILGVWKAALDQIEFAEVTVNATAYEFRTSPAILQSLMAEAGRLTDEILLQGGQDRVWFALEYVAPAFEEGTAISWRNLGAQVVEYRRQFPELRDMINSAPYQRRLGLLYAREFEEMQALSGLTKANMGRTLAQGLGAGDGPLEIARRLADEGLVPSFNRAKLIARTEINQAHRTARLDEAQDATQRLGIQTREMHLSALSPTTRPTHAARHGNLYTIEQARNFWASTEACNCKCSTTSVLVDASGKPLSPSFVAQVKANGKAYFERNPPEG